MHTLVTILEIIGAYSIIGGAFTTCYVAYLRLFGRRQNLNHQHLLAFYILAPIIWIGFSILAATAIAYCNILPAKLSTLFYCSLFTLVPTAALTASVLDDVTTATNSVSPSGQPSRNSSSAPKRPPTYPPPPRHRRPRTQEPTSQRSTATLPSGQPNLLAREDK